LSPTPERSTRGFTLLELLIVVVLLGILAAVVIPSLHVERRDSVSAVLRGNLTQVAMVLEVQRQKTADGTWPAALEPGWFVSGILPPHPDNMAGVPAVEVVRAPGNTHPADKLVHEHASGAYWYNLANGVVRARVKGQDSAEETLAFYNEVNQCALASLGDLVDGAGPTRLGPAPATAPAAPADADSTVAQPGGTLGAQPRSGRR